MVLVLVLVANVNLNTNALARLNQCVDSDLKAELKHDMSTQRDGTVSRPSHLPSSISPLPQATSRTTCYPPSRDPTLTPTPRGILLSKIERSKRDDALCSAGVSGDGWEKRGDVRGFRLRSVVGAGCRDRVGGVGIMIHDEFSFDVLYLRTVG